jgi:S-formylglutathione hydrolase
LTSYVDAAPLFHFSPYASNTNPTQGTGDNFYKQGQLLPENFAAAAKEAGHKGLNIRYQPDYDHSYYTMASFADDHVEHAAKYLFA